MNFISHFKLLLLPAIVVIATTGGVQAQPKWERAQNGAIVYNPNPQPNESVMWTGGVDQSGYASGDGMVLWLINGQPFQALIGRMSSGRNDGQVILVEQNNEISVLEFRQGELVHAPISLQPPATGRTPANPVAPQRQYSRPPHYVAPDPVPSRPQPVYPRAVPFQPNYTPAPNYVPNFGGLSAEEKNEIKLRFGGI